MKKIARYLICFMVIISYHLSVPAATPQAPIEAVEEMMESVKNLDVPAFISLETAAGDMVSRTLETVLTPVLPKLEYSFGNSKVTGNRAVVDMTVTAADIGSTVETVLKQAAGLLIISRIFGVSIDIGEFVLEQMEKTLGNESLTMVTTNTTVYLILGGDGKWKLDLSEEGNFGFLKALSGGAADLEEPVMRILETLE